MENIHIRVIQGRNGLASIKDDWGRVAESLSHKRFFHLYQWYKSYIDTIETDHLNLYFFVMYRNNVATSIFPLKKTNRSLLGLSCHVLEIPNHPHVDLSDFICGNNDGVLCHLRHLLDHLRQDTNLRWDFIYLPYLLEDSPILSCLRFLASPLVAHEISGRCDYIVCDSIKESYKNLSKNFRGNLRKARNKLLRLNNVQFVSATKGIELSRSFEQFLDVEASGWKGTNGTNTAIKLHPKIRRFYASLLTNYSQINNCEINLLRIDGECAGGQFCLVTDDTKYILKIAYNEKYSKLAPGNMLLENVIQRSAADENIKYVNFITGSDWHADWKPRSFKVFRAWIFNRTPAGLLSFGMTKIKQALRPVYHRYVRSKTDCQKKGP